MPTTKGLIFLEAAGEKILVGMYTMRGFNENNMKDGKPFATISPNDATIDTPSLKQRDLSCIQRNEAKFCDRYGNDSENGPFLPERIISKTVQKDKGIIPTPETPTVGACFCRCWDNSTTRCFIYWFCCGRAIRTTRTSDASKLSTEGSQVSGIYPKLLWFHEYNNN